MTRCTKPSQKGPCSFPLFRLCGGTPWTDVACAGTEYIQISKAVAIGFAIMGFIGYFVKLIHIPMYVLPALLVDLADLVHSRNSNNILVYVQFPLASGLYH
jgi:SecE/Sec61-gamma subunits of protein translocation complex